MTWGANPAQNPLVSAIGRPPIRPLHVCMYLAHAAEPLVFGDSRGSEPIDTQATLPANV
jgi:hypothetical protein